MKKLALLVFSLLIAEFVYGQSQWDNYSNETSLPKEKSLFLSVYGEGGLSISSYHATGDGVKLNASPLTSFNVGAGINMRFVKRNEHSSIEDGLLGLQAGILYTKAGFKVDGQTVSGGYICIPIDFQVYPISGFSGLFIEAGPEMCINLGFSPDAVTVQDMNLNLSGKKVNDLKISVGAGYVFSRFHAGIHVKYLIGTSNFAENLHWKGNQLRISFFYRF